MKNGFSSCKFYSCTQLLLNLTTIQPYILRHLLQNTCRPGAATVTATPARTSSRAGSVTSPTEERAPGGPPAGPPPAGPMGPPGPPGEERAKRGSTSSERPLPPIPAEPDHAAPGNPPLSAVGRRDSQGKFIQGVTNLLTIQTTFCINYGRWSFFRSHTFFCIIKISTPPLH